MKYNVVLDIDQVLAFHHVNDLPQGQFFLNKGAILTAIKTHYIYPGAIEFIRAVALRRNVRLTFYSAGLFERNIQLVPLLLNLALPEPQYFDLKSKIRTLSREDLVQFKQVDQISQYYYPELNCLSFSQKDLRKVLSCDDCLSNGVLIDDQSRNAAAGQLYNLLEVPVSEADEYASLIDKMQFYSADTGMRYLKCVITPFGSMQDDFLKDGNRIAISKKGDDFEIKFQNREREVQALIIDSDKDLYEQLNYFYEKAVQSRAPLGYIDDAQVVENICKIVSDCNGRSKKICRRANRICYVAGLLFTALNFAETNNMSLKDALIIHQFNWKDDDQAYEPIFHKAKKNDRYYWIGLCELQEVNPLYELITPHNYHEYSQILTYPEGQTFLKAVMNNEF